MPTGVYVIQGMPNNAVHVDDEGRAYHTELFDAVHLLELADAELPTDLAFHV
jgi:hypothetical protein